MKTFNAILLALVLTTLAVSYSQTIGPLPGQGECPHVEILRGRDGRDGDAGEKGGVGEKGDRGLKGEQGELGEKGVSGNIGERGPKGDQGEQGESGGGAVYTRWGRNSCPSNQGTELVYAGRTAGTPANHNGGGANYICLPDEPDNAAYERGVQGEGYIAGVDYWFESRRPLSTSNYHNAPCAVCYVPTRSVALMIPGKTQCPGNWTLEYNGYLVTQHYNFNGRTSYECVDGDPDSIPYLNADAHPTEGRFHLVEPLCGSLKCPPYNAERELPCCVCSR